RLLRVDAQLPAGPGPPRLVGAGRRALGAGVAPALGRDGQARPRRGAARGRGRGRAGRARPGRARALRRPGRPDRAVAALQAGRGRRLLAAHHQGAKEVAMAGNEHYVESRRFGEATVTLINDGSGQSTIVKQLTVPEAQWRRYVPEASARGEV